MGPVFARGRVAAGRVVNLSPVEKPTTEDNGE